jgi:DNA end-binding protein Ku
MAAPSTRSIANLDLTVGLVSCPVKMVGIIENHDRKGSMYHQHDDGSYGKVKMPKSCEGCGETLSSHEICKGFDENGETIVLTASELETVAANTGTSLEVPEFVKADQIDPMLFADQNVYRLIPDPKRKQAEVTYKMIRKVLAEDGIVGIVTYVRWGRNHLALLDIEQTTGSLIIRNMMWPDELREASGVPDSDADVDPRLMPVMRSLAETMTKTWKPSDYTDTYTDNLNEAISVKAAGGEIASIAHGGDDNAITDVSDLLAKLTASIEAKSPAEAPAPAPAKKAPVKRAAKKIA